MLVFRTQSREAVLGDTLDALRADIGRLVSAGAAGRDEITSVLIDAGELSSAVADHGGGPGLVRGLLSATERLALALVRTSEGQDASHEINAAAAAVSPLSAGGIHSIAMRPSEGFAYYAVLPELYMAAAGQVADVYRALQVTVVGLQTIGVALGAVVTATLRQRGRDAILTIVRPSGPHLDRRVTPDTGVASTWRTRGTGLFLIVDEGPGISGSSMSAAAAAVSAVGADDRRIVLMPAHRAEVDRLASASARLRWKRHDVVVREFEPSLDRSGVLLRDGAGLTELSAGAWRDIVPGAGDATVHPQHERRKFLRWDVTEPRLVKFAGLGRYGRQAVHRINRSAADGWTVPATLRGGWAEMPFIAAPCARAGEVDAETIDRLASYLAWVRRTHATGKPVKRDALVEMAEHNLAQEGVLVSRAAGILDRNLPLDSEAVHLDARMAPHEWLRTANGLIKTDCADHGDDHFYPGPTDIAWDVAATMDAWRLPAAARHAFLTRYVERSGDRHLHARLSFYRVAYAAFRLGYARLASSQLAGTPDGRRFAADAEHYRAAATGACLELAS